MIDAKLLIQAVLTTDDAAALAIACLPAEADVNAYRGMLEEVLRSSFLRACDGVGMSMEESVEAWLDATALI